MILRTISALLIIPSMLMINRKFGYFILLLAWCLLLIDLTIFNKRS